MNVLLVSDTLHAGGAETFVLRLADKLIDLGVRADILSLNPDMEDDEIIRQFPRIAIHRIRLPMLRWIKRLDRLLRIARIDFSLQYHLSGKAIARRHLHYDVYHTHLFPVDYLLATLKKNHPRVCIVSTLHGDYNELDSYWDDGSPERKESWPQKVALLKAQVAAWVYISKTQIALFRDKLQMAPARLHKVYNGYESTAVTRRLTGREATGKSGLTFIMVARGIRVKGWEYLLQAFRMVHGADHRLIIIGKGDYLAQLEAENRDERVRFLGFHPAPVTILAEADVFLFPSVYKAESLPTVIIEALYCGVPVIASDIGDVPEMITDPQSTGYAGFLLDYTDTSNLAAELAGRMSEYIADPLLLASHSERAVRAFDKFDMKLCADRYIKTYEAAWTESQTLSS